jgi:sulfite reductase alpha subunit-like flavoprotein
MEECVVLYGSEFGTAEDVAFKLYRQSRLVFKNVRFSTMDDYDIVQLPTEKFVVFVCSTTGDGEAPSNMQRFWKFLLRKVLDSSSLVNLRFAVFGLGDSSYEKFNASARFVCTYVFPIPTLRKSHLLVVN